MTGRELQQKNKSIAKTVMTRMTTLTIFSVTNICRMLSDDKEEWDLLCKMAKSILLLDIAAGLLDSVMEVIQIVRGDR